MNTPHRLFWLTVGLLSIFVMAAGAVMAASPVPAGGGAAVNATVTVDTLVDESDGSCSDGDCSLRDAVAAAATGDTIDFDVTGTITLTLGRISVIGKNLTISGPGAGSLTISGNDGNALYLDNGLTTAISGLTIVKGGDSSARYGIYSNGGTLNLTGCALTGNSNGVLGGGTLNVTDCTFSANTYRAISFGGTLNVTGGTFSGNTGGGIFIQGAATVTGSTFSNNSTSSEGGGIDSSNGPLNVTDTYFIDNNANYGGAIYIESGTTKVTDCTFSGNGSPVGSAIYNWDTLDVIDSAFAGNTAGDRGTITNNGTLHVTGSTFSDNDAPFGNIHNDGAATVTGCSFSGNSATTGGGINNDYGTLEVISTTFSGNDAIYGSGIHNNYGCTMHVAGSSFTNNSGDSCACDTYGGGIDNSGTATVVNSTFSGNSANFGGGAGNWGSLTITNCTFNGNSGVEGGGIYTGDGDSTILKNTIIAGSPAGGNCWGAAAAASANNLSTDGTCSPGFGQVTPAQLRLGALIGSPPYIPLKPGSAAIDAGTNDGCPAGDQRGAARPQDGDGNGSAICDVGAYEYVPAVPVDWIYLPFVVVP